MSQALDFGACGLELDDVLEKQLEGVHMKVLVIDSWYHPANMSDQEGLVMVPEVHSCPRNVQVAELGGLTMMKETHS